MRALPARAGDTAGSPSALAREPTEQASAALRQRIEWMGEPRTERSRRASPFRQRWLSPALAAVVLVGVASATAWIARRDQANRQIAEAPLLRDALADCRRAMARNFPKKADLPGVSDGLHFQAQPLRRPGVDLFSTWKTTLAGTPAAGLAYRWRGIVVVQYSVPAELIRQQPGFGASGPGAAFYEGSHLGQGVIALLEGGSGTLLIAEVPPAELRRLIL